MSKRVHILITGPPGIGKTTIVKKLANVLNGQVTGFYTEEIRGSNGTRLGFDVISIEDDSKRKSLARELSDQMGPKVGKYTVILSDFESVAIPCLKRAISEENITIIDEIGKKLVYMQVIYRSILYSSICDPGSKKYITKY